MTSNAPESFVGRVAETGILDAAFAEACRGRGRCVLVVGEAGMGKTFLAEAVATQARGAGACVAWGRCVEGEGAPPYWPWLGILRACSTCAEPDSPLHRGYAELALELRGGAATGAYPTDSSQARFGLFERVARLLATTAERAPLALFVDDLHAADTASLRLLRFVAGELRDSPALVVCTMRAEALDTTGALAETVGELLRVPGTERLPLTGWSAVEVGRYLELALGWEAPEGVARMLHQRTDGNPFFVAECGRVLIAHGATDEAAARAALEGTLPATVRAVVLRRLADLPAAVHEVLSTAAVIGREFALEILRAACDLSADAVHAAIRDAQAHGAIDEPPAAGDHRRFAHALVREALYDALAAEQRARLHQRVAAALAASPGARESLAEIAFHWNAGGEPHKAARAGRAAGDRALGIFAFEEAERLYRSAVEDLRRAGAPLLEVGEVLLSLGQAQNVGAQREAARDTFRQVVKTARRLREADEVGAGSLLGRAALGFTGGWTGVGEVASFDPNRAKVFDAEAVNLLEEALALLGDADAALRACLMARRAVELHLQLPFAERDALSREAAEIARRSGDSFAVASVLSLRHATVWTPENAAERLAMGTEIVEAAQRAGDRALVTAGRGWRVLDLLELGQVGALRRELDLFASLVEETRQPFLEWVLGVHRAMLALAEGNFAEAESLIRAARTLGLRGRTWAEMYYSLQITALRRERGQSAPLGRFADFLKAAVDQYPDVISMRTQLAFLLVEMDRLEEAHRELDYLAARDFDDVPRDMTWMPSLVEASEVCAAVGDAARAKRLYELLSPFAERMVLSLGGTVCWGSASRTLGQLAAVLEHWEDAERHFEVALAANRQLGSRVWVAHTQHLYGTMLLARGEAPDVERGRYLLDQSRVIAESLGMRRLLSQVSAKLAPAAPPSPARALEAVPPGEAIFRRESDYWTIAFDGSVIRLRDVKGARYLAHLLQHPGREFHVTELISVAVGTNPGATTAGAVALGLEQSTRRDLGDAGEKLDRRAAVDYRKRLRELGEELAEAQDLNDLGAISRAQAEIEFLTRELVGAARSPKTAAHAERARLTVTKAIKKALDRIREGHPKLARHLEATVKRGYFCSYTPDPRVPLRWQT